MIFKPNIKKIIAIALIDLIIPVLCVLFWIKFNNFLIPIIILLISTPIVLRSYQIIGSTLIMDKNGCTVKFLFFQKAHKWNDFKTIQVEDLRANFRGNAYDRCILFSIKGNIRPFKYYKPYERYAIFGNLFDTFAVYFIKYNKKGKRMDEKALWACDEEEMLAKLKEWGVEPTFRVYDY